LKSGATTIGLRRLGGASLSFCSMSVASTSTSSASGRMILEHLDRPLGAAL
jgi:hypothetical protein